MPKGLITWSAFILRKLRAVGTTLLYSWFLIHESFHAYYSSCLLVLLFFSCILYLLQAAYRCISAKYISICVVKLDLKGSPLLPLSCVGGSFRELNSVTMQQITNRNGVDHTGVVQRLQSLRHMTKLPVSYLILFISIILIICVH